LVYPVAVGFYSSSLSGGEYHIDALFRLQRDRPNEYEAVQYLNKYVDGTPVILEAVSGSYSDGGRISAFTGLPTVLGWPTHVFWFHGSGESQVGRQEAVTEAYQTGDHAVAARILDDYNVELVYVGWLERAQYGESGLAKFRDFMDIAFEKGEVTIYRAR
jgi:uncharacterized membrane protein